MMKDISIILGNQLVNPVLLSYLTDKPVFMCESDDLCTHFKYHKLKIIFFLTAMRDYADELGELGCSVSYFKLPHEEKQLFFNVLETFCVKEGVETIHMLDIEDKFFLKQIAQFCKELSRTTKVSKSPLFLTTHDEFQTYLNGSKKPFMKTFYEQQRKTFNVLMDNKKPLGGKWSFDEDNRKKTPKSMLFPTCKNSHQSTHLIAVKELVEKKFKTHIGETDDCWFPTSRQAVHDWFDTFISERFNLFGDYEDAIDTRSDFLYHSALSPFINCGLLTPQEILEKLNGLESSVPLNSLEGFIRQIIGWREFIRGIYHEYDDVQQKANFFNHKRKLTKHWYLGTTGVPPLDDAIKQVMRLGYTHHINRLMVIGNVMLLCQVHPQEVYRWFMECFIDSSDWVMGPNVFGMSQFSDGGIFATKPYFCGSNYIRKMSHYPKGPWCDSLDALYWRFIADHQTFFSKNFRMKFMVSKLKSFSAEKIQHIYHISDLFINQVTIE